MPVTNHPQGSTLAKGTLRKVKDTGAVGADPPNDISDHQRPGTGLRGFAYADMPVRKPVPNTMVPASTDGQSSKVNEPVALRRLQCPDIPARKHVPATVTALGPNTDVLKPQVSVPRTDGTYLGAAAAGRAAMTAAIQRNNSPAFTNQRPVLHLQTTGLEEPADVLSEGWGEALQAWNKIQVAKKYNQARVHAAEAVVAEKQREMAGVAGPAIARKPLPERTVRSNRPAEFSTSGSNSPFNSGRGRKSSISNWIQKAKWKRNASPAPSIGSAISRSGSVNSLRSVSSSIARSAKVLWGHFSDLDAKEEQRKAEERRGQWKAEIKATISKPRPDAATVLAAEAYDKIDGAFERNKPAPLREENVAIGKSKRGTTIGDFIDRKANTNVPSLPVPPSSPALLNRRMTKALGIQEPAYPTEPGPNGLWYDNRGHLFGGQTVQRGNFVVPASLAEAEEPEQSETECSDTVSDSESPARPVSSIYSPQVTKRRQLPSTYTDPGNPYAAGLRESQYMDDSTEQLVTPVFHWTPVVPD